MTSNYLIGLPVVTVLLALVGSVPALAVGCQDDIAKLSAKRQAQIDIINKSAKAAKGKLDPVTSCPRLRNLAAIESEFLSYMVKNQDWCHIPDDAVANVKAGHAKTASVAAQACNIAKQVQRAQQQQAAGGAGQQPAVRLPTGPL